LIKVIFHNLWIGAMCFLAYDPTRVAIKEVSWSRSGPQQFK